MSKKDKANRRQITFAFEYRIQGMIVRERDRVAFPVTTPSPATVVLTAERLIQIPDANQHAGDGRRPDRHCYMTILAKRKVHPEVAKAIDEIKVNGFTADEHRNTVCVEPQGRQQGAYHEDGYCVPERYEKFVSNLRQDLFDIGTRLLSLTRWRSDASGPHQPVSELALTLASTDGREYFKIPLPGYTFREFLRDLCVTEEQQCDILNYYSSKLREPVGHHLFREAWDKRIDSPRSALLTGIAALESGVKQAIADLAPDWAEAILTQQSPPVVELLAEDLPRLPARLGFNGTVLAPPESVLEQFKLAVSLRNRLAHSGTAKVDRRNVQDFLASVHDVLSLLDYYRGYEWALGHVSKTFLEQLDGVDVGAVVERAEHEDRLQNGAMTGQFQLSDLPQRID